MYYCNTCKIATCSDCAMFGEEHKGHKFQKLNEVYEKHVKLIKGEAENLRSRLKELNS